MTLFPVFLMTCAAAGTAGAFYRPGAWYRTLDKPDWTPPNWAFPVMWAVLYVLIALAATRVSEVPGNDLALGLWGLQITIKSLWSRVFFRTSPDASGGADHRGPWGVVLATTVAFWALDVTPSLMMVPYLIWGTYALALNTSVWLRNRDRAVPPRSSHRVPAVSGVLRPSWRGLRSLCNRGIVRLAVSVSRPRG